ncbi:Polyribonucleotide nucleotidyltransferase [Candidatus Cyrtobacter comes]|uniref:Polyribonucleotide nucleotidyltransferase n=1 Tax=Candidatus Cyrtobacter comes TaxID=675776 RepID=A0ABU5L790_9RICK|nr:polyribonucleotide nucleotidyltransferase [Candidatus Cyrtobacter comes]MDZ5761679.1 Polyribonucleotide nucleotidyltransferase [Candidatus Cyrtobacter comes]
MFKELRQEVLFGGESLSLSTGKIARHASGSVVVSMGGTVVLCAVVVNKSPSEDVDFFPLSVTYQEKFYAAGKFPGGFQKREGKPSDREVLISRLIDRPIRPLFPKGYRHEVSVVCTVLSYDPEYDPAVLSIIGSSAALCISDAPFMHTLAAVRVGFKNGAPVLNLSSSEDDTLDMVVAGTHDSIMMVESSSRELSQQVMLDALGFAHDHIKSLVAFVEGFAKEIRSGNKPQYVAQTNGSFEEVNLKIRNKVVTCYEEVQKVRRRKMISDLRSELSSNSPQEQLKDVMHSFDTICYQVMREKIVGTGVRADGRSVTDIRGIYGELDLLPRAHGSALFTRGDTQACVVVTLGSAQDEQIIDNITGSSTERLMLHYNFPPYSVGESGPMRPAGRREIGHGRLALRAISAVTPGKDVFPYTVKVVSEITESDGSSSMATVCGASLSMMASGIPLSSQVAGIAMGLIKDGDKCVILSDITGEEDYLGDMDFKIAGTKNGITAFQMDIKIPGINFSIFSNALSQAYTGIEHILGKMNEVIDSPRAVLSKYAPVIKDIKISKDKIKEVIGAGGKIIKDICERSGAKVDIKDSGDITIYGSNSDSANKALGMIEGIVAEPVVGQVYQGVVVKIAQFGAFVRFMGTKEGLVHVSELSTKRVEDISEVVQEEDEVNVRVIGIERDGKIRLSMREDSEERVGKPLRSSEGRFDSGARKRSFSSSSDDENKRYPSKPRSNTRGDSRDTRGDSRDTRGDSRDTRGDSRDTRGDSRDTRRKPQHSAESDIFFVKRKQY